METAESSEILDANHSKYLKYFTNEPFKDVNNDSTQVIENEKAEYCHPLTITDKKRCNDCENPCSYRIEDILSNKCPLTQTDILKELSFHNHPRSRVLVNLDGSKRQRVTSEAARELADHYRFAHHKEMPDFSHI